MSKIIRLKANNFKRLEAIEIAPDGNLVTIGGKNGQGKSSVLDAITAALGGVDKKATPKPIRDGENHAEIVLETEELTVTRRFTTSGSTLTVTTPEGAKFPKGQQKLNDLLGKLSLDPLAFTQLSDKDQLETLIGLVDLPFDPKDIEAKRKSLYGERSEVGRQGKAIGEVTVDDSLPAEEVSASAILTEIREIQDANHARSEAEANVSRLKNACRSTADEIERLTTQLKDQEAEHDKAKRKLDDLPEAQATSNAEERLATVEDTNAKIRDNNEARSKSAQKATLTRDWHALTTSIKELDQRKSEGLAAAQMPVDGLGFDENGVTYEGIPFKQVNTAMQIRVSLAMAMALNPELRVIRIAEGSLLDEDNMKMVAEMAADHDMQVWVEIVGDGDGTGIIIEDGAVREAS